MRVPAGKFLMGSNQDNGFTFPGEIPQHIFDIPYDFWMARAPVTNELFSAYVKSKGGKHPVDNWDKKKNHPVCNISWNDAMAYCQWSNNLFKSELSSGLVLRLPTDAEWEKAARGTDGREYPWGNTFDKTKCNTKEGGKKETTQVGFYSPQGDSPYGCADMSGNVWEWTNSFRNEYPYKAKGGREGENTSVRCLLRGGSFFDDDRYARCAYRKDLFILDHNYDYGFRVTVSPMLF